MSETAGALGRVVAGEIGKGAAPGAAWWVGDARGALATGFCGHAAVDPEPVPLRLVTPFDLASLTKPLATAPIALILESQGRMSLDATLGSIFPQLSASPFARASLRDAATHRAGFPAWAPLYLSGGTPEAYIRAIAAATPHSVAGGTLYSDLGYLLLGFAIEKAGGASLDRLFDEAVAGPLRLSRCGFPGTGDAFHDAASTELRRAYEQRLAGPGAHGPGVLTEVSRGRVHDGNAWGLGGVAGHAGLFGTAADVAEIARALLDPERLGLAPGAFDAMFHPADAPGGRTVGFQLARDADSVRGVLPDGAVGHWGFTGTSVWIDTARPRIYVLLTNRVHPGVPTRPFTATRRAFHEAASRLP